MNSYQDPNSATPRSRQGMGRSMSPSLTISRVTVAPTGSSSAMVRNPLMVSVAPSARDTGKGTTCRPIRGEHCCHVTSSPPITAHLGRVEGAWLGAARAEAVLEVVQLEDGGGGGQGEAGGQQQHLHPSYKTTVNLQPETGVLPHNVCEYIGGDCPRPNKIRFRKLYFILKQCCHE